MEQIQGGLDKQVFTTHYGKSTEIIENKIFKATKPGDTAIELEWPSALSIAKCSVIIRNCGFESGTHEWANCIKLTNAWHAVIENCWGLAGPTGNFQNGVILDGQSMNARVSNCTFTHPVTGVLVTGESEGTKINGCEFLASVFGIMINTPQGEAGAWVTDTHISAAWAGIVAINRPQAFYSNLLIYKHPWRAKEDFSGIFVGPGSHNTSISHVQVNGLGAPVVPVSKLQANGVIEHDVREIYA